jgi:hypothetical protein
MTTIENVRMPFRKVLRTPREKTLIGQKSSSSS